MSTSPDEVRFLLDENMSPNIVPRLWEAGIDALHIRDRARLRWPDYRVLQFAASENRAVATINEADFEKLVKRKPTHPGVVVVPSGGSREEQYEYLTTIADFLRTAPNAMEAAKNHIICVNEEMTVTARLACSGFQPVLTARPSTIA